MTNKEPTVHPLLHVHVGLIDRHVISHFFNQKQADKVCAHMSNKTESKLKKDLIRHWTANKEAIKKEPHLAAYHMCCEHLKDAFHDDPTTQSGISLIKKHLIKAARQKYQQEGKI